MEARMITLTPRTFNSNLDDLHFYVVFQYLKKKNPLSSMHQDTGYRMCLMSVRCVNV